MTNKPDSSKVEQVSCDICLKEVPLSEAVIPEAADYVAHFCGLECYTKWKQKSDHPGQQEGKVRK